MKTLSRITALAAILAATSLAHIGEVHAQATTTSTTCRQAYLGGFTCTTTRGALVDPRPRVLTIQDEREARAEAKQAEVDKAERVAKWEAFCKPRPVQDKEGITRMAYAHEGCDMGRSQ